ncbi:hypothetical protein [Mangrovibacterium lignilyticum]|uniref:hypothetical protein n=1 Tax=Mangrovibacterium lignilyticum TaxID=2668052 RepID=UPI0013D852E0|nr:hypothetical protein [Mangrovibacterium lignilyticum]
MRKKLLLGVIVLLFNSCATQYSANLNPKTNYFNTNVFNDHKKRVTVITDLDVHADSIRHLLIVPNESHLEIAKNLDFFHDLMTFEQFEDAIIQAGLADEIKSIRNRTGLHQAAILFRPFVVLEHVGSGFGLNSRNGFRLYDPLNEQVIFENEMREGPFDPSTPTPINSYFPLYNSLLDYLRKQQ